MWSNSNYCVCYVGFIFSVVLFLLPKTYDLMQESFIPLQREHV